MLTEMSPDCGVRLCCLCPPFVKTNMTTEYVPEDIPPEYSQMEAFHKYGGWNE